MTEGITLHSYPLDDQRTPSGPIHFFVNGILNSGVDAGFSAFDFARVSQIDLAAMRVFHVEDSLEAIPNSILGRVGKDIVGNLLVETADPGGDQLAKEVRHFLTQGKQVVIHAHSRGTLVVSDAMSHLTLQECRQISLRGYGGVRLFPKGLAGDVVNVVNLKDDIAHLGQGALAVRERASQEDFVSFEVVSAARSFADGKPLQRLLNPTAETFSTIRFQSWGELLEVHGIGGYVDHFHNPTPADQTAHLECAVKGIVQLIMELGLSTPGGDHQVGQRHLPSRAAPQH